MNSRAELLLAAGLSETEALSKARLFERVGQVLAEFSPKGLETQAYFVPGRIEVLGKHTDYAGGRSLLCTVERGFCLMARPRHDAQVNVINARSRARCALALEPDLPAPEKQWCTYPGTAVRRLVRNFPMARMGADIAFVSDLPAASGMSSSSAFIVAVFLILSDINRLRETEDYRREIKGPEDLAGYLGTVENGESFGSLAGDRGVGTFGGSEDHTAILCCRAGELKQYSFCPIRHERSVAMPEGFSFVLAASGVIAMKTGAAKEKYNRAALMARKVLDLWCSATGRKDPTLAAAIASAPGAPDHIREVLSASRDEDFTPQQLCGRFEHFLEESDAIIPAATHALASGDLMRFGELVDRSQLGAEKLLENQVPETVELARSARLLDAAAASAFGAGFGGSVWAMVPEGLASEFERRWASRFRKKFPASCQQGFFTTRPGPPGMRLDTQSPP
jgi:galactokinase